MDSLKISPINALNIEKVLSSSKITDAQKAQYILENKQQIHHIMQTEITKDDFVYMMKTRPLVRFKPIKNSFTKRGDKVILAKSLGIPESKIESYIENIIETNFEIKDDVTRDNIQQIKTYVYRHGKKDEVAAFLDYELSDINTMLKNLYKTLDDELVGMASYFVRPIHRMDNFTLEKLYNIIDRRIREAEQAGVITSDKSLEISRWALVRIYQIQNNSKLIHAFNAYKDLTRG